MVINEENNSNAPRRNPWISVGIVTFILIFVGAMFVLTPKSFNMSHEQIGGGKPVLVFVYDLNLTVSIEQAEQMNKARDQIGDKILFLVAKINTPEGDQLISKYGASATELLLFDGAGQLVKRQFALKQADELIRWLND